MYNLTVALAHTFVVGDMGWVVHNTTPPFDARKIAENIRIPLIDRIIGRTFTLNSIVEITESGLVLPRGLVPQEMMNLSRSFDNREFGLGLEYWFREQRLGSFRLFAGDFAIDQSRYVHIPSDIGSDLNIIEIFHTHPMGPSFESLGDETVFLANRVMVKR